MIRGTMICRWTTPRVVVRRSGRGCGLRVRIELVRRLALLARAGCELVGGAGLLGRALRLLLGRYLPALGVRGLLVGARLGQVGPPRPLACLGALGGRLGLLRHL